jgi:hypothetical protein
MEKMIRIYISWQRLLKAGRMEGFFIYKFLGMKIGSECNVIIGGNIGVLVWCGDSGTVSEKINVLYDIYGVVFERHEAYKKNGGYEHSCLGYKRNLCREHEGK